MIMLAITAQCPYTFGPALPTNFSKKGLILLSNLGPNPPSLIYFKFNKYILYSTYRQELQILLRLTYCIPCKHKITTFINILVINIHDQGQSNFDGGYFFLSTHCITTQIAGNAISEGYISKFFRGSMPPDPPPKMGRATLAISLPFSSIT